MSNPQKVTEAELKLIQKHLGKLKKYPGFAPVTERELEYLSAGKFLVSEQNAIFQVLDKINAEAQRLYADYRSVVLLPEGMVSDSVMTKMGALKDRLTQRRAALVRLRERVDKHAGRAELDQARLETSLMKVRRAINSEFDGRMNYLEQQFKAQRQRVLEKGGDRKAMVPFIQEYNRKKIDLAKTYEGVLMGTTKIEGELGNLVNDVLIAMGLLSNELRKEIYVCDTLMADMDEISKKKVFPKKPSHMGMVVREIKKDTLAA